MLKAIKPRLVDGKRLCGLDWCGNKLYARGYCATHYHRVLKGQPILPPTAPVECGFDGCARPTQTGGLCKTHDAQRRRGSELKPIREHRESPDKPGLRHCKTCGEWKDREEDFYDGSRPGQKQSHCKKCLIARHTEYAAKKKAAKNE